MLDWAKNLIAAQTAGWIRHMLSGAGGSLVMKGLMTSDQETQIIGGAMAVLAVAWSLYQKRAAHADKVSAVASATMANASAATKADFKGLY